jgi:thiol-disulfide isomerase/thioredoxin
MTELKPSIITLVPDLGFFKEIMETNPGLVIIKLGATWCGPCKVIELDIKELFSVMPSNVQCLSIDIDDNIELYSFLKKKRVVNGVPAILCYKRGNTSNIPDDYVIGASKEKLHAFKERCIESAIQISK